MNKTLTRCPVCQSELEATRLHCTHCDTTIEGHFIPATGPFAQLSPEQMQFLLAFIRCEGRFNRLEEELKLSYPTLRNRLADVMRALGYEPGREEPPTPPAPRLSAEERRKILEDIKEGRLTVEEGRRKLKSGGQD